MSISRNIKIEKMQNKLTHMLYLYVSLNNDSLNPLIKIRAERNVKELNSRHYNK